MRRQAGFQVPIELAHIFVSSVAECLYVHRLYCDISVGTANPELPEQVTKLKKKRDVKPPTGWQYGARKCFVRLSVYAYGEIEKFLVCTGQAVL